MWDTGCVKKLCTFKNLNIFLRNNPRIHFVFLPRYALLVYPVFKPHRSNPREGGRRERREEREERRKILNPIVYCT